MTVPALILGLLAVGLQIAAEWLGAREARALAKVASSTAFLAVAYGVGALETDHGRWLFGGLVLSWVGDVALLSDERRIFLGGIVAFLLAHLAYAGAFLTLGVSWPTVAITFVVIAPLGGIAMLWLRKGAGNLFPAVMAYVGVIEIMVALAVAVDVPGLRPWPVAAVLFYASDLAVARERFVQSAFVNRAIGLPLYYGAQFAFALSAGPLV